MKLITNSLMQDAFKAAIKKRADDLETKVINKFKNAIISPTLEEKLISMLDNEDNPEITAVDIYNILYNDYIKE